MTLIPSTSDTAGENLQPDEIPAPLSLFMESATENWERFRHAAVDFSDKIRDTMTMSEVIRQISNG